MKTKTKVEKRVETFLRDRQKHLSTRVKVLSNISLMWIFWSKSYFRSEMSICLIPYSILMKVNKFLGLTYNRAMEPMIAQWGWYKRTLEISSMKRLKEENPFLQVEEQARFNHQEWWHHGHRIVSRRQYKSRCCKNGILICKLSKFQVILLAQIKICFRVEWILMTWWVR